MKRILMISIIASIFGGCVDNVPYTNVAADEFEKLIAADNVQVLDCRTIEEYEEGHIQGAVLADVKLENFTEVASGLLSKDAPVAVYCRSGRRSVTACELLSKAGYGKLYNLETGIIGWKEAGKAVCQRDSTQSKTLVQE